MSAEALLDAYRSMRAIRELDDDDGSSRYWIDRFDDYR